MAKLHFKVKSPGLVTVFNDTNNGDLCVICRTNSVGGIDKPYRAIPMFVDEKVHKKVLAIQPGTYESVKDAVTKLFS